MDEGVGAHSYREIKGWPKVRYAICTWHREAEMQTKECKIKHVLASKIQFFVWLLDQVETRINT